MTRNILQVDRFHPSIASVYHAVEGYLEYLATALGAGEVAPPLDLPPIDALLIHLLAKYQPARPDVADLAAVRTHGVSTVLCRTSPAIRQVVVPCERSSEPWQPILDHYLSEQDKPLTECVEVEGTRETLDRVSHPYAPSIVIAPAEDRTGQPRAEVLEDWLKQAPRAVVVLLGIGSTGNSPVLASLTAWATGSRYRLALARELAPSLAESQIVLLGLRENTSLDSSLSRIGQLFASQFRLIDLIERVCGSVLEGCELNIPIRGNHQAGVLEPQECKTPYDWRRVLAEREQELLELRQRMDEMSRSLTFRFSQHTRRILRKLAPEGSTRRRLANMARTALHGIYRGDSPRIDEQSTKQHLQRAS